MKRVVITGIGMITPLGRNASSTWENLIAGKSGIKSLKQKNGTDHSHQPSSDSNNHNNRNVNNTKTHPTPSSLTYNQLPSQIAGFIDFPLKNSTNGSHDTIATGYKDEKKLSPFMIYGMHAATEAIQDSGWIPSTEDDRLRTGVCIGSGIGCLEEIHNTFTSFKEGGYRKVTPFFVPKILINLVAGHVALRYGFKGPNHAVSTACATGAHAIGDAMRFIQYGDADVMIAGGTESSISPLSIAGFAKAKSLSTAFNDYPEKASRPFDKDRDGFVMSEGSGVVVLEEYEHAKARNAKIYAEIKGYGLSCDAHHYTAPSESGDGAFRAMKRALEIAEVEPHQLTYINAHATSTPLGDLAENRAIKRLIGPAGEKNVRVSSSKGSLGHLLGAAGSVEAIITILSLYHNILPHTLNLESVSDEKEFSLKYLKEPEMLSNSSTLSSDELPRKVALSNSFGFGGTNTSLCFSEI